MKITLTQHGQTYTVEFPGPTPGVTLEDAAYAAWSESASFGAWSELPDEIKQPWRNIARRVLACFNVFP